jgi:Tol biopolymer transport system component
MRLVWTTTRTLILAVALLVPSLSWAQLGYHFGRNKIQYSDFDWQILRTPHFDIYFYPEMEELAEMGAYFAEEVYEELENRFEFSLNHRVPLIFYSSNLHFKETNVTPGFIPDGVGGFFEFMKGRVVVPANGNIHRFRRVIRHELVHVFTHSKVARVMRDHRRPLNRFLPLWLTEGLAEYWSGPQDYQHEMVMRDAVVSNYLVPLESMYRIYGSYLMYKQGEAICRFVAETYGEEKLLRLIENFWKDRSFNSVMEVTLHEPFLLISKKWEHWLRSHYYRILEDTDTPMLASQGIVAHGFNAKPVYYESKDGERRIYYVGNKTGYGNVYSVKVDSLYRPVDREEIVIRGERSERFEAFHLFDSRMDISADGKLAFSTKSGGRDVIHVYDVERDELIRTYKLPNQTAIYSPSWGPSGDVMVFSSIDRSGFSDLYLFDTTSQQLRRLTNDIYDDRDPDLSPDGRYIAFSSDRTTYGEHGARNIFVYDLQSDHIRYVTYGDQSDFSPRWSPDGSSVVYTSSRRDSTGRFSGQDVWVTDISDLGAGSDELASLAPITDAAASTAEILATYGRTSTQLTRYTSAAFDPVWTPDNRIVLSTFESFKFTVRTLDEVDELLAEPRSSVTAPVGVVQRPWSYKRLTEADGVTREDYKRKYNLDVAASQVSQNPIWGTSGGAFMAFSDMLGDDYWYFSLFSNNSGTSDFLRSLSFSVSRTQLHRRANTSYGIFRFSGQRYDITDPDVSVGYPVYWETMWGGFASVSYPISKFRRLAFSTGLAWSDKEIFARFTSRKALLLSNAISLVHDNALYGMNGPVAGWRANLMLGYTTDIRYSNVSYYTISLDLRKYWRIFPGIVLAARGLARINEGREARLHILGGSWDLRGYRRWSIRGKKLWFTSLELRFPIMRAPSLYLPLLAPFGIADLRGALFSDLGHAWNDGYNDIEPELRTGQTLGAVGGGVRANLYGVFVIRYDLGYRHAGVFERWDTNLFHRVWFGYNF